MLSDGRYTRLDANLRTFRDRYDAILTAREPDGGSRGVGARDRGSEYQRARDAHYAYVERERAATGEALARLAELDAIRAELLDDAYQEWRRRVSMQPLPRGRLLSRETRAARTRDIDSSVQARELAIPLDPDRLRQGEDPRRAEQ
jgi:hypothetical protein